MSLSDFSISSEEEIPRPRISRILRTRIIPMDFYNDIEFKNRYRLSKIVVIMLLNLVEEKLKPYTLRSRSISALEQLLLAISYYSTGAFQITIADHVRMHKSTACRIIKKVSAVLSSLCPQFIKMPATQAQRSAIKQGFYNISAFANIIGAIDCTHIRIQLPGGPQAELFRNRKGYFSLNVQVICDSNLKILDVICRWPGSAHDTTILNDSHIRADFESGVYGSDCLLGDSGYPCRSYLLTPFLRPSTPSEEAFNRAQINTRNPVERCFGVLKRRFPCLPMGLRVKLDTTINIVVACCVLHNIAIEHNDHFESNFIDLPQEEDVAVDGWVISNENTSVRSSLLTTHFNW